jgi:hypothetical protein
MSFFYVVHQPQQQEVKKLALTVGPAGYHALVRGLRYRVYYVPGDHRLFSIEPLP